MGHFVKILMETVRCPVSRETKGNNINLPFEKLNGTCYGNLDGIPINLLRETELDIL